MSKVKQLIKNFIRKCRIILGGVIKPVYQILHSDSLCLVKMEGGLASQLEQYTLGTRLKELGYNVWYDTSWYTEGGGKDVNGVAARNLDIMKLDRNIDLKVPDMKTIRFYQRYFAYSTEAKKCASVNRDFSFRAPIYLGGYGYGLYTEPEFEDAFSKGIKIDFDEEEFGEENLSILKKIEQEDECIGIHVRRGDTLLPKVGRPIARSEYYLKALSFFDQKCKIWIFSDDPEWVSEKLIPKIPNNGRCTLVTNNKDDCGWCDMILLAGCTHIIKSPAGGLARDAYRLSTNPLKSLVLPVFVPGNMAHMQGNVTEIILDDTLCDLQYVKNRNIRL